MELGFEKRKKGLVINIVESMVLAAGVMRPDNLDLLINSSQCSVTQFSYLENVYSNSIGLRELF